MAIPRSADRQPEDAKWKCTPRHSNKYQTQVSNIGFQNNICWHWHQHWLPEPTPKVSHRVTNSRQKKNPRLPDEIVGNISMCVCV